MDRQNTFDSFPLISDQVSPQQLGVILRELEAALDRNPAGNVVEFGCYIGTTSLFIRRLLDERDESTQREFRVYDSFEGLPEKVSQDESPAGTDFRIGALAVGKKDFLREFKKANLRPPTVHKAWFKDLTPSDVPDDICFAFLDGDFYESIRDSLKLVLPKLTPQATIVIDDYTHEALPGVAKAIRNMVPSALRDRIRVDHNLGIITL